MVTLSVAENYEDENGNVIHSPHKFDKNVSILFAGHNNSVFIDERARFRKLAIRFDCDNGTLVIGPSKNTRHGFDMSIRIGQDSTVKIGTDVTSTTRCLVSAVEGASVTIGDDVMLASENQIRSDDAHPIFDVATGKRVNPAKDIRIGNHVWLAAQAVALGGANIADGSIVGFRSIVTGKIPNNCVAVGSPARVVRRNVAWERPHLSLVAPPYKPDISAITKSEAYWNLTETESIRPGSRARTALRRIRSRIRGLFR